MGLFSRKPSGGSRLADAVAADAAEAFARFVAAHGEKTIIALALCSVDDAAPPYIMGATLEDDIGPIKGTDDTWRADPADWLWSDGDQPYRCGWIIGEILEDESRSFEKRAADIFQGIVAGLNKFDASGQLKGKLPRAEMLLVLWINDPNERNAQSVMKWVGEMNPEPVSQWLNAVYSYRP
jgi:hypothetical protein